MAGNDSNFIRRTLAGFANLAQGAPCSRCGATPPDVDSDEFVEWELISEKLVCPNCITPEEELQLVEAWEAEDSPAHAALKRWADRVIGPEEKSDPN